MESVPELGSEKAEQRSPQGHVHAALKRLEDLTKARWAVALDDVSCGAGDAGDRSYGATAPAAYS